MKKTTLVLILGLSLTLFFSNCKDDNSDNNGLPPGAIELPSYTQRDGDPVAGYEYLVYGDYVGSGVPLQAYSISPLAGNAHNRLGRTGDNANVAYDFTAVNAPNGVRVVAANCLACHASVFRGELVVGMGASEANFTDDQSNLIPTIDLGMGVLYGNPSPEWEAYEPFRRAVLAVGPQTVTESQGVNPADKLAAVLAAHRNPEDLTWSENPLVEIPEAVPPTDVPAWWHMQKKNTMFYNALGRKDFARFMMSSSLLTVKDTVKAREIDGHFADVLAYLQTIEPPTFPNAVDETKVTQGEKIFNDECAQCHGTYGDNETYPNLLIRLDAIQTDPYIVESYDDYTQFVDWYNSSWFSQAPYDAFIEPERGYVAPPLDGIWATAPYLHNASVPTLEALLDSSKRPTYWERSFDSNDYDLDRVGWNYTERGSQVNKQTYDTTLLGYGNEGHYYGDALSDEEREQVMEYLKTL